MLRRRRKHEPAEADRRLERAERDLQRAKQDRAVQESKAAEASHVTHTLSLIAEQNNIAMLIRRALQQHGGRT